MTIIRRIINWIINWFKKLFGSKNNNRKLININEQTSSRKNKKQKDINSFYNGEMPPYMIINDTSKEKLLYTLALMKNFVEENHKNVIESAEKELIDAIKMNKKANLIEYDSLENKLSYNTLEYLIKNFEENEKKEVIDKYQVIKQRENDFKVQLDSIDKLVKLINSEDISLITENEIDREINNILNDKNIENNIEDKTDKFIKKTKEILDNVDDELLNEVIKEYKKVNYVTLTTTIIDRNFEKFKQLEEDYKNHRYNKFYYERELNRIKRELNKIKNLKNNKEINNHITNLQKELYTKSKDKYDLLYNNEVFTNLLKECDTLLEKINIKVVDIKKEEVKEEKEESEEKKKKQEYVKNILLRFEDMAKARKLILNALENNPSIIYQDNLEKRLEAIYDRFNNGIEEEFNFIKNKNRTEYVILYNDLNQLISEQKKEEYYTVDHINFRIEDLKEAVGVKINEVSNIMKKRNIEVDDTLVKEKIGLIKPEDKRVLKKDIKEDNKRRK